jgi:hypothetical protein
MPEPQIFISKCTRAVAADLVARERTLQITLDATNFQLDGHIFYLRADDYLFSADISKGHIRMRRNDYEVDVLASKGPRGSQWITIFLGWTPEKLQVSYGVIPSLSGRPNAEREVATPYTAAPPALIRWLRKQNLVETITYASEADFRYKVSSVLVTLQDTVDAMTSEDAFWDLEYDANRIISRKPKREADVHPLLHAFLLDQFLMSGIEVMPEHAMGAGRLDFLLVATVRGVGLVKTCMEVKSAHSDDLFHGLTKQLPMYMSNAGAHDGIYLVLWYGVTSPRNRIESFADIGMALMTAQLRHHDAAMCKRITTHYLDLTRSPKASRPRPA